MYEIGVDPSFAPAHQTQIFHPEQLVQAIHAIPANNDWRPYWTSVQRTAASFIWHSSPAIVVAALAIAGYADHVLHGSLLSPNLATRQKQFRNLQAICALVLGQSATLED